ncbi:MAG: DinB family protein [Acidimicrobiaceae bacterium]|nr:DinB family protein [Acidimicrobiaceae bacterium]
MALPVNCEVCGFRWDEITPEEIAPRLVDVVDSLRSVMFDAGEGGRVRPSPLRWSILEYAGHLRDVFISIRERMVMACVVDEPTGTAMFREERVNLGFYTRDSAPELGDELSATSQMLIKVFDALTPEQHARKLVFSPVTPVAVSILWAAAQAVHEGEHHLADVRENLTLI